MVRPKSETLALRSHISGQSFVRVDGRNIYLGRSGEPKTLTRYSVFVAEYQSNGLSVPDGFDPSAIDERAALLLSSAPIPDEHLEAKAMTVKHLCEAYRSFVLSHGLFTRPIRSKPLKPHGKFSCQGEYPLRLAQRLEYLL